MPLVNSPKRLTPCEVVVNSVASASELSATSPANSDKGNLASAAACLMANMSLPNVAPTCDKPSKVSSVKSKDSASLASMPPVIPKSSNALAKVSKFLAPSPDASPNFVNVRTKGLIASPALSKSEPNLFTLFSAARISSLKFLRFSSSSSLSLPSFFSWSTDFLSSLVKLSCSLFDFEISRPVIIAFRA